MRERPILFSAPMVRALLDGRKTQTRRAIKWPRGSAPCRCEHPRWRSDDGWYCATCAGGVRLTRTDVANTRCPYGVPGDLLWGRETCIGEELLSGQDGVRYTADDAFRPIANSERAAIDWLKLHTYAGHSGAPVGPRVPSIHMPRWASRITLRVTDVRVERLNDISEADALAEGLYLTPRGWAIIRDPHEAFDTGADAYRALWQQINGPGSWDANPRVWAVSFEVAE